MPNRRLHGIHRLVAGRHRLVGWLVGPAALLAVWAIACGDDPLQPAPEPPNRPPTVTAAIPAQTIPVGETATIDLNAHFGDPDQDTLSFAVETDDPAVAMATVTGTMLAVGAVDQGTTDIGITASDPGGLSATQRFSVTVPNRAPVVTDSIPMLGMVTGDSVAFELLAHFSDPDGDALSFSVEVSEAAAVTASVSGDTLTVVAQRADTATLMVGATDPGGLSALQPVAVAVVNQPPVLTDSIPKLEMFTGDSVALDLAAHFSDPDGDTLGFSVETSDEDVASAYVSSDTLTVVGIGAGTTEATITARDPGGLTAAQSFDVTVPNRAPMLTDSIDAVELFTLDPVTIDLSAHFSDPDGDALNFNVETSNPEVATASLSGHFATIGGEGRGTAEITVTGRDPLGLTATQTVLVTVPNRQPAVTESIRRQPVLRGESIAIDLSGYFSDPDGDALEFTALTSDDAVASASTPGGRITVAGVGPGKAEITVIAQDPGDLSTAQSFVVTVPGNADRDALIALYEATDGPNWKRRNNWLSSAPLRSWEGVTANAAGRVTGVQLGDNGLVGTIPPELGWLTELTHLHLYGNNLKGAIPPELGRLRALKDLNLYRNSLTGAIPQELGDLAALTNLLLAGNSLTGSIPPELGTLSKLRVLSLKNNALTSAIPPELGRLHNLVTLSLYSNNLTGSIPPELGRMGSLERLWLSQNKLGGALPAALGQLRSLVELDLEGNNLTGSTPPELGQLHNLESLSLRFNELTDSIPPELGGMATLEELWLDHNLLTGSIPSELGGLRTLQSLWLHSNRLTGSVPDAVGDLQNLRDLYLDENALTGAIPRSLLYLDQLKRVHIAGNDGLCVPGVAAFAAWTEMYGEAPLCNEGDMAGLTALFESTGGNDWADSRGWLAGPLLERWYGVVSDSVGKVLQLDLGNNGLSGRLPPELGELLDGLTVLRIGENALFGPIPRSLAALPLIEFDYAGTSLCVPADEALRSWLNAIPVRRGSLDECPLLSDRDILVRLYEATDGQNWVKQDNWVTDAPIGSWFGVSVDADGRVTEIKLGDNGLSGRLPLELGGLSRLRRLWLPTNGLSGSIPPELGKLAELSDLALDRNEFTGTIPPQLGSLASLESLSLGSNGLNGRIPPQLGRLSKLDRLDLGSNELSGHIPSEIGRLDALTYLRLVRNRLTGRIPAALGNLADLGSLGLDDNRLVGSIPAELGNLLELRDLTLSRNQLSGPIPSELGRLTALSHLHIESNDLSGSIPTELADLNNLTHLALSYNRLTGPIPPWLGTLSKLETLGLSENNLTGPIPPELGMLDGVRGIAFDGNDLTGSLPAEIGKLTSLEVLDLSLNASLDGPLPPTLTQLGQLRELRLTGTNLCVADHTDLLDWLGGVGVPRMARCNVGPRAYLTQAVQSREFPVPLVAGEEALLRVFVTARRVNRESLPPVRATFFVDGREVYRTQIAGQGRTIPTRVDESSLENSANALIPGRVVQPGLEMMIEVDPEGDLDPSLGVDRRIPKKGRLALDVSEMPPMDLTLIPFLWSVDPDSTIVNTVRAMAADPENHELLWDTRTLLPVNALTVRAHDPVWSSTDNPYRLVDQTQAIRALEGGRGHYMGMLAGQNISPGGLADAPGRVSFSIPEASVIAHELGHNMSLLHAPCGAPGFLDPVFPQIDGSIGDWGYDFRAGRGLVDPHTSDLMSYCDPQWIGEYGFSTALHHRLRTERPEAAALAPHSKSLLLWGGADADGNPFLEPAFVVEAPSRLPGTGSDYGLEGRDEAGAELFSLTFDIPPVADGDGAGAFAFVLPAQPGWEDALATISLTGPAGSATLSAGSEESAAILLDARSGQVRGILRDLSADPRIQAAAADGLTFPRDSEVLFSRGIPDPMEWRRY